MKPLVVFLAVTSILMGCSFSYPEQNLEALMLEVHNEIEYRTDQDVHGCQEYWQSPAETERLGTGDCEDMVLLFLDRVGYGDVQVTWIQNRGYHVIGLVEGRYYDVTRGRSFATLPGEYVVLWKVPYWMVKGVMDEHV